MTVCNLRNAEAYIELISFDTATRTFGKAVDGAPTCGQFSRLNGGRNLVAHIFLPNAQAPSSNKIMVIDDLCVTDLSGKITSRHDYIDDDHARLRIEQDGQKRLDFTYRRDPYKDYGAWLVGYWETEREKDLVYRIHVALGGTAHLDPAVDIWADP